MNTKHTPGPWAWQNFGNYRFLTAQHGMREIIIGSLAKEMPAETYPAMSNAETGRLEPVNPESPNAKLIAAAPDLLKALMELIDYIERSVSNPNFKDKELKDAEAAIKKATE